MTRRQDRRLIMSWTLAEVPVGAGRRGADYSHRDRDAVVEMLRGIADAIEPGNL
ncbi:hypothetical protein [Amycolatopsis sp. DG1A-15b]|uniref:hypothetical protein n=1 Tax=Amycolatopsis sp. DG1A-15b TaxID=3052846 RepID=UPI00255BC642|nr:hypothetical protein [Amycolatopsis sp. DG1A-15b]WIX85823.1 hypothetical protein QRY02_32055 [Amycolatopsis sp. DG1A-15b]